jgi:signal transduction histidine kinase
MVRRFATWLRRASGPAPHPSRRALAIDAVLAVLLTAYALIAVHSTVASGSAARPYDAVKPVPFVPVEKAISDPRLPHLPYLVTLYVIAVLTIAPLAWRRRFPLAVFWIVLGLTMALPDHGDTVPKLLACAIVAYTAAAHGPYRSAASISLIGAAAAVAGIYERVVPDIPRQLQAFLVIVPIAAAGISMRSLRARIADAQERERALERDKAHAAQLATEQERARIARELHDVITHHVSVMVVQAGAARKIMSRAPDQATSALLAVESAGRAAMTELQHTMGLLAPDGEAQLAPQPGLAELGELIGRVRTTGMRVDLVETGPPRALAPGSDLAAYRVVQEALTNAAKHAAGAAVRVRIEYTERDLIVEVDNTVGRRSANAIEGNGRGLVGLRERLAACGGELDAGPLGDGGFHIRAAIPLQDVVETV